MNYPSEFLPVVRWLENARCQIQRYWFQGALVVIAVCALNRKDVSINIHLNSAGPALRAALREPVAHFPAISKLEERPMNVSLLSSGKPAVKKPKAKDNAANHFSTMPAAEDSPLMSKDKRKRQEAYVKQFSAIARREMDKYGIPASITLAQGLLESDAGISPLAKDANNHFGIKCFSKTCKKGHCRNYTDDSHKDFFRIYPDPSDSYRSHSQLLQRTRYKSLFRLNRRDYKAWAKGLQRAGYATDPHYGEKLIRLIDNLDLHRYDK
ncbi:MAG: glucosaminidase domain-containing protein [Lewinellaceae bacterium]|nr:glucosaminidase domain-containing protein [Lewinellaceae bacterium]